MWIVIGFVIGAAVPYSCEVGLQKLAKSRIVLPIENILVADLSEEIHDSDSLREKINMDREKINMELLENLRPSRQEFFCPGMSMLVLDSLEVSALV